MKFYLLSLFTLFTLSGLAQGTLQFNQVKLISNTIETVPTGKVWKVTAIYGQKFACWPMSCPGPWPVNSVYSTRSSFKVNGAEVTVFNSMFNPTAGIFYSASNCTGSQSAGSPVTSCLAAGYGEYINSVPDRQTTLPLWLPAGTTLQSTDAAITLSLVEFNVIP
ncbi:MAG: hypothetical protein IT223_03175 [Crocinitomicaceae bacterium]|nr:hypothetical protein [Crocinitomicaceae bacterium]